MSEMSAETIRLVGGHPAVDFINTVDDRRDPRSPDALTNYQDAVRWARRAGIIDPALEATLARHANGDPAVAAEALTRLLGAREVLYEVFLAEAQARPPATEATNEVAALAAQALSVRSLAHSDGKFVWTWIQSDLDAILHRVVLAAAEFLTQAPERRRLSQCMGSNCGWLFLDTSRAGRRRWCSSESCGTNERVRRFRNKAAGRLKREQ